MHAARLLASLVVACASAVVGTPVPASAASTVDCGSDPNALQPAIDAAISGSTLVIEASCPGTFTVGKDLTLKGSGATLDASP